jgi:hypothetical protein
LHGRFAQTQPGHRRQQRLTRSGCSLVLSARRRGGPRLNRVPASFKKLPLYHLVN